MCEIMVRVLTEADWYAYRALRLAALHESPEAFVDSYAEEVGYSEEWWRNRMRRASRLLAERHGVPRGIVSCAVVDDNPESLDVFGLWVDPATRQAGVAWQLMEAAVRLATAQHRAHLYYQQLRFLAQHGTAANPAPAGRVRRNGDRHGASDRL